MLPPKTPEAAQKKVIRALDVVVKSNSFKAYLAAQSRQSLASVTYEREKQLHEQKISAEQDFLAANRPDTEACLVLDIRLPGINGLDFQAQLAAAAGVSEATLSPLTPQERAAFMALLARLT